MLESDLGLDTLVAVYSRTTRYDHLLQSEGSITFLTFALFSSQRINKPGFC